MFGFGEERKESTLESQPQDVVIPFPSSRIVKRTVTPEQQCSYEEVAQSLGFAPAELTRAQLVSFFEKAQITLYDYSQVCAWLSKKNGRLELVCGAGDRCGRKTSSKIFSGVSGTDASQTITTPLKNGSAVRMNASSPCMRSKRCRRSRRRSAIGSCSSFPTT